MPAETVDIQVRRAQTNRSMTFKNGTLSPRKWRYNTDKSRFSVLGTGQELWWRPWVPKWRLTLGRTKLQYRSHQPLSRTPCGAPIVWGSLHPSLAELAQRIPSQCWERRGRGGEEGDSLMEAAVISKGDLNQGCQTSTNTEVWSWNTKNWISKTKSRVKHRWCLALCVYDIFAWECLVSCWISVCSWWVWGMFCG